MDRIDQELERKENLRRHLQLVRTRQEDRVVKRRRHSHDPAIPEVTTPSHDPSIEPLPEVVSMSEVPAKIQEMETILQRLLRTVYGPKGTPGSEMRFSEKVPKYGLVAECQWRWEHIKNGQANMHDVQRQIKFWSPW